MRRLIATMRRDVILQNRYRFYAVSGAIVVFWGIILSLLFRGGSADAGLIVPAFMLFNLLVTTFYFMAAMVLLERTEGMLTALIVTPLRDTEYFASKIVTLSTLALVETLLIVLVVFGVPPRIGLLVTGALFLGALYVLIGFISVAGYESLTDWIMPSAAVVTFLSLPLLSHFGLAGGGLMYFHPLEPTLVLMRASYTAARGWDLGFGFVGSSLWIGIGVVWARRRFQRFVVRSEGGR